MSVLNVQSWTPIEVADWISGLDVSLSTYSSLFLDKKVTGHLLLNLMTGDLQKYGVHKIGDQLLLQDAILTLRNELDLERTTLQTLSSTLAIRCRNYRSELSLTKPNPLQTNQQNNYIPTESLSSASYLLDSAKVLIRWLTRFPFIGNKDYDDITVKLSRHCFELAMLSQRDSFADNAIEEVQYLCTKIIEICEGIVHSKDSLIIQPAAVDLITLRKRTEQELGLSLESSYFGLHQVSSVKQSSPAQQSGHLEKGDEILQVNYQTVLGWPQLNLVNLLHENSNEVILTIKRRPRHATTNYLGHMYLRPKTSSCGSTRRRVVNQAISPVLENSSSESELVSPTGNKKEISSDPDPSPSPIVQPPPTSNSQEIECSEKPEVPSETSSSSTETKITIISESQSRFWKLYPRPRNLIKRRATVTGASPTNTRPPVTFVDDEEIKFKRPPLINSKSAPEKILLLRKQGRVVESNVNRVTLPVDWEAGQKLMPVTCCNEGLIQPRTTPMGQISGGGGAPTGQVQPKTTPTGQVQPIHTPTNLTSTPTGQEEAPKTNSPPQPVKELYAGCLHLRQPSNPRWTRYNSSLNSNRLLKVGSKSIDLKTSIVSLAAEVHSRPFAFKVIDAEKTAYYLAAESHLEFDTWIKLINQDLVLNANAKRNNYKRSVSLGNSPSLRSSSSYASSQSNLSRGGRYHQSPSGSSSVSLANTPRSLPLRTSSIKLKQDWFNSPLRLSQSTSKLDTPKESNISSITITSLRRSILNQSLDSKKNSPVHQPTMGVQQMMKKHTSLSDTFTDDVFLTENTNTEVIPKTRPCCPSCGSADNRTDKQTQTENQTLLIFVDQNESRV